MSKVIRISDEAYDILERYGGSKNDAIMKMDNHIKETKKAAELSGIVEAACRRALSDFMG